ncbi:MAG: bifunctional [glutamate--ammonia ligase]-adenylyl-L-tyrosine phosphorylase/[glutamate--ammonia-ligase] adenylyltransferase [Planctomycetaceae bacterium]|nr:bifunctional [glutamate--ammonia ligase]-adenylyl-L-tyrosine phosphorylase/[glutamate--ammonia-ligase] adenylyltransferase [Planctomycetales bacterium]MCB9872700.1 bifunctional [glutamate--ammonia ligase]-adenylyl-L-tyrosine phosphorylase/[glutamate--ammonia-ligase] adenylyltransferase [Planctomycetaceae bacterium]MCB9926187.1 bifunctional [glutamate--ammonia ligase]-adenylyl-L-tyrosine phosphorylase/[glutamate--ammonia-ligase] adenylyltransferase [Planctomycetaceae bacterium]
MQIDSVVEYLDSPAKSHDWLRAMGIDDVPRAHRNLVSMADTGVTLDLLAIVWGQLSEHMPRVSDPDAVLNSLERFISASRSPLALASLFDRDRESLPSLLQIFSASQYLSDLLIRDPESYDLLRLTEGQPVSREVLINEICSEVKMLSGDESVMEALRRFKRRETLRIAYGDIIRKQRIETVTRQISFLADAICEAALQAALRRDKGKRGAPKRSDGEAARFVILALGKLGGIELNYSSDIDLVMLYEGEGRTEGGQSVSNQEFFERLVGTIRKFIGEPTDLGAAYRVDLRLRPDGSQGPVATTVDAALRYYDTKGRTWERQAFVKARAIAGDLELGQHFLKRLEPWIYRRYLTRADITGIKALKRRIEQRSRREGTDSRNVKTGAGGIRDIEFVIQFLQLLNGGDLAEIRVGNTLAAIGALEQAGCLTMQERTILEQNYEFLRNVEHRLQIMFDLQTHSLPVSEAELRRLAIRMSYVDNESASALTQMKTDLTTKTELNRKILDHLLHDAFGEDSDSDPETDLVLDPSPLEQTVRDVLGRYRFADVFEAHKILSTLATEKISFLSTRRCRHFLASIAPRLLRAIAATPDPDATLVNLSKVSDSLGGKGVLWELFSFNPPSLKLYVQLCASSSYLSGLLTSNPGMIDELMDSLILDRLPTLDSLRGTLGDLSRGAVDVEPILQSFKHSQHLRVGVRDILNRDDIQATHRALSDIAEVCLSEITRREYAQLVAKHGEPTIRDGERAGQPCSLVVLALGKLGGREPNYHSDLDIVFLYEADGMTKAAHASRRDKTTTNQHFFGQLAQRIIKVVTQLGPQGRLYELDARLRPNGKSGSLALSLDEFGRYFESGQAQLWERQSLCKARPIYGTERAKNLAMQTVRRCIVEPPWSVENVEQIRVMRHKLQETATPRNLKRGPGGTVDIEFIVQMTQLRHAAVSPDVLVPGTLDAITALRELGYLPEELAEYLSKSYRFLRSVESGLRLMNTTARHDLPRDQQELDKLSYLLGYESARSLLDDCREYTRENRKRFQRVFGDALS